MDWDTALFFHINGLAGQWPVLDWIFFQLSQKSNLYIPMVFLIPYWFWVNRREALVAGPTLGLLIGVGDLLGNQLKQLFERPRPCQVFMNIQEFVGCGGAFSMPSNHAVNSAAAAAFLTTLYPKAGWVALPLAGFVGLSRVYLGAHYITDVLGGWAIGGMLGMGTGVVLCHWSWFRNPSNTRKGGSP